MYTNHLGWPQFFYRTYVRSYPFSQPYKLSHNSYKSFRLATIFYHEGTLQLPWKPIFLVKTVTSTGRSASPSFLTVKSIGLPASLSPRSTKSGDKVMLTTTGQLQRR